MTHELENTSMWGELKLKSKEDFWTSGLAMIQR